MKTNEALDALIQAIAKDVAEEVGRQLAKQIKPQATDVPYPKPERVPRADTRPEKLWYSRKDVAYVLSISVSSVDNLLAKRFLPRRILQGRVLIPVGAVKRFAMQDHWESVREV